MKTKPWWESKTLWVNILGLAVVVLEYAGTIDVVNPEVLASVLAVLNVILRVGVDQSKNLTLK